MSTATQTPTLNPNDLKAARRLSRSQGLFAPDLLKSALVRAFVMLRPDVMWKNPVMFTVEIGTVLSIVYTVYKLIDPGSTLATFGYLVALDVWLLLTVIFANFAEALAEARGKAQADALRKTRQETPAFRLAADAVPVDALTDSATIEETVSTALQEGDLVVVTAGEFIPGDGEIVAGVASIDESAITGESAPRGAGRRRRPLRRHRRNASAVGPRCGAYHCRRGEIVSRPG